VSAFETHSEEETVELGRLIAATLPKRAVVLLIGNLGAGKTTLAKGIIAGLGVAEPDEVASPTFTLIHEYGEGRIYHIDLYRLDRPEEVATLGLDEIFDREAVVLIEWGERFLHLMPVDRIEIRLDSAGENNRRIAVTVAAVIHAEPTGGYWGEVPALPGCYSQGETVDELLVNLREAIADVLEEMREEGRSRTRRAGSGTGGLKPITGPELCRKLG
jgi:tRNA threonylcarbamoyladenosine biosynthesis protein TsaE